ncbi:MAG: TerC family protein [Oxalobacteraceae bacterium]|nr:TerC family protein [Oxalobacteraceae bacterium]
MLEFFQQLNWLVVGQIILIDILLGGDNAIVIALACRHLPEHLRMKGIVGGALGAIVLRIILIAFAVTLLSVPYLKIIGGILLIWIGMKLLVMSIDNVIAVAAAAEQAHADHKMILVAFGIMVSIPVVIWGSSIILKVMHKFPAVVTLGAALLGYLGGAMISHDLAIVDWTTQNLPMDLLQFHDVGVHLSLTGTIGAILVVALGAWVSKDAKRAEETAGEEATNKSE